MPLDPNRRHFKDSDELCAYARDATGPRVVLSFSAGKDSVAAWVQLRRFFQVVVPVYLYYIPDLEFVEETLLYYEQLFSTRVIRLPEQSLVRGLDQVLFQTPRRARQLERANFHRDLTNSAALELVRAKYKLEGVLGAEGVRMADSFRRRLSIQKHGPIYPHQNRFFPCYDWSDKRLREELRKEGVKLCSSYRVFKRTFEGARYAQLEPMRRHYPRDYRRVLSYFPLAEAELFRRRFYDLEGLASEVRPCPVCGAAMDDKMGCPTHRWDGVIGRAR
ncbi:MAG: phosphoadenosine phosphosulfate reductase [Gemmatimonadetes bacterium]|nr:phosphoadenosine phosphosulfate reductase [Gemmatimonadota bacterium]